MVAVASASILESIPSKKATLSQEGLHHLFQQVEAELYQSEIYQRALAALQNNLETSSEASQALVKAVGREAIRLALRQLVKQCQPNPTLKVVESPNKAESLCKQSNLMANAEPRSSSPAPQVVHHDATSVASVPYGVTPAKTAPVPPPAKPPEATPRLAVSPMRKSTQNDSPIAQKRLTLLRQIGSDLQQARLDKGMSLEQLYSQTWIPVHQIRALEMADIARLPEDIYVRGFVRRIADALGLDGEEISNTLLVLEANRTVIPSWQQYSAEPAALSPMHLYLSYAALMAGALGGLAWISYHPAGSVLPNGATSAPQSTSQMPSKSKLTTASLSTQPRGIANPEVSLPQTSRF
jgi:hypothetical protein